MGGRNKTQDHAFHGHQKATQTNQKTVIIEMYTHFEAHQMHSEFVFFLEEKTGNLNSVGIYLILRVLVSLLEQSFHFQDDGQSV